MRDKLANSILLTTSSYFIVQSVTFCGFAIPVGFFDRYGAAFLGVSLAFHLFLLALLFRFKEDFVIEGSGEKLERINIANRITLLRVSSLPTLLYLVIAAKDFRIRTALLVLVVIVFGTDFADGYVSRKLKQVTRVGRMMDSASDYSLLIVLTIIFYYYYLIPIWFFALVVGRLGIQSILMTILVIVRRKIEPKTSLMGKVAVAGIMLLYAAELLKLVVGIGASVPVRILEFAIGFVVFASIADKIVLFARELSLPPKRNDTTGTEK